MHVKSQIEHQLPDFSQQLAENARVFIGNKCYDIPQVLKELRVDDIHKFRGMLKPGEKPAPVQPLEMSL